MPIPNADSAFIPPEKLSDYLMDMAHPIGGTKARWFISLGYHSENSERLETDLLKIVRSSSDFAVQQMQFGVKYIVQGQIESPSGRPASVRTVWITETDLPAPRLVTAYPNESLEND